MVLRTRRICRRDFLGCGSLISALALFGASRPTAALAKDGDKPLWVGFGLNGSATENRFYLTREYVRSTAGVGLSDVKAFDWFRPVVDQSVKAISQATVRFGKEAQIGQTQLLGFVHDYEAYSVFRDVSFDKKDETTYLIAVKMVGAAILCSYEKGIGWRISGSFPFVMEWEKRERGKVPNLLTSERGLLKDVYVKYGESFARHISSSATSVGTVSQNFFARLTKASVHQDAKKKLDLFKIGDRMTKEYVGFTGSSEICRHLRIPILPYQENDALAKRFAVRFADSLIAQNVIEIPEADLQFEVLLRDIEKELRPRMQYGVTEIRRLVVVDFRVYELDGTGKPKRIMRAVAYADDDIDKIPFEKNEYDTPDRDFVFFDKLFVRTMTFLLSGISKNDPTLLARANVKHAEISDALPRLKKLFDLTR